MILDTIDSLGFYRLLLPQLDIVAKFLAGRRLPELPPGKAEIDRGIFVISDSYTLKPPSEKIIEYHRKYVDLHLMVEGSERIGNAPLNMCVPDGDYNPEKDFGALSGDCQYFHLLPESFAVFFPHDAHRTGLQYDATAPQVRKLVFKIPAGR
jgi:biofilm protein TabA